MNAVIDHVAWSNKPEDRPGTLLVVALHGRGSDESAMVGISVRLPKGVTVASPRGPLEVAGGYTWFENRGTGRPVEASVKASQHALLAWLDTVAEQHTGVVILGFSAGTCFGGGLLLSAPERFAGAVLLSGNLPFDAGFDFSDGRLAGMPVFWSIDVDDPVITRELVVRSEEWLREHSGAQLEEHHYPGIGHAVDGRVLEDVHAFVARLASTTPA